MLVTGAQYVGDKTSPGPGAYNTREINKTNISYSFRPRTNAENLVSSKHVPGPGAYTTVGTIDPKGKYQVSKFKNSGATIIAPSRGERGTNKDKTEPGPGQYDLKTGINTTGAYFVSKFKSNIARSFGHSMRKNASVNTLKDTPGPGSYRLPSEFGHYEAATSKSMAKLTSPDSHRETSPGKGTEKSGEKKE